MKGFTHLHLHSEYSLLDGMNGIKPLVHRIKDLGMDSCGITDHGVLYGIHEFYEECKKNEIKAIIGCEVYLSSTSRLDKSPKIEGNLNHLVLIAKNEIGYKNLIKLVSKSHTEGFYYKPRIDLDLLNEYHDGLISLSACLAGSISRRILNNDLDGAEDMAKTLMNLFGKENFFLEVQRNGVEGQETVNNVLFDMGNKLGLDVVATCDSHYLTKEDAYAHEVLLCIDTGKTIDDPTRMRIGTSELYVKSPEEMYTLWKDHIDVLENTQKIKDMCDLKIDFKSFVFPKVNIDNGYNNDYAKYLRDLTYTRGRDKIGREFTDEEIKRIEYELDIISSKGFASYMLLVSDFTDYLRKENIPTTTRGSAAGSFIAYLIGIVPINPLNFGLSFERFLNPLRPKAPDIDLDIASARREDVFRYALVKYGKENVSQIVTFGRMKSRAAIRDVGRVLNIPLSTVDQIAKLIPQGRFSIKEALEKIPELKEKVSSDPIIRTMMDIAKRVEGISRHSSIHACGVLITPDPVEDHVPVLLDRKLGRLVSQYNMVSLEELGYMKMDFLGLTNLDIITETIRLVKEDKGIEVDLEKIHLDDKKTFKLLQKAETLGVFQLESRIMKDAINILRPETIFDISALIALNRPGPMANIPVYAARKDKKEKTEYLDPRMENYLSRSYGILVYQEDLLKTAINLAGYDWGEVDKLRKATGKKKPELLMEMKDSLIQRFVEHGMDEKNAEKLFELFIPFAHYAFNEAHAASYAMISYRTAYLKANYPVEFIAAFLESNIGDLEKVAEVFEEAKSKKIKILPPDINKSNVQFCVEDGNIRFGLNAIKGFGRNAAEEIVNVRSSGGPFKSIDDFCKRIDLKVLNKRSFEVLIKSGGMDLFGNRNALLQSFSNICNAYADIKSKSVSGQSGFFDNDEDNSIADLNQSTYLANIKDVDNNTKALWEKELLGVYMTSHPLKRYLKYFKTMNIDSTLKLRGKKSNTKVVVGGILQNVVHHTTKRTEKRMAFARLEDMYSTIEVVIFPKVYEIIKDYIYDGAVVIVKGNLEVSLKEVASDEFEEYEGSDVAEYKIIVDDITPVTDSDLKKNKVSSIEINIPQNTTREKLSQLNGVIKESIGNVGVSLRIFVNEEMKVINLKDKVKFSGDFIERVSSVIGEDSLVVK